MSNSSRKEEGNPPKGEQPTGKSRRRAGLSFKRKTGAQTDRPKTTTLKRTGGTGLETEEKRPEKDVILGQKEGRSKTKAPKINARRKRRL